ncbi:MULTISPECIES: esterase/lipase family protein [Mycobacterium]|nr:MULTISPECIES: alpha/beta hydrolase [Mycobacterium]MDP7727639.1 alpha/beta hydrolase [Mycobacterium sp. TY813]
MRRLLVLTVVMALATMLPGCGHKSDESGKRPASQAVVIVSGGDATSPYTTPDQACATGLAAGNTDTAIREYLLKRGYTAYTSPAMAGRGQVVDQTGFGPFGVCPVTLPENMTVDSTGSIDTAGEHLARFLNYLHTDKGVTDVDVVAHSMGGLYSRAAIRVLATTNAPVHVRSLTTIGTPWQGSYLSDYANGIVPLTDCVGDTFCENAMKGFKDEVLRLMAGSGREVNQAFLMGKNGWNDFQSGVLDKIPVVLIGGKKFAKPGQVNPAVWPNDGLVALQSALAKDISDPVLPHRRCYTFDDTHSIYVSNEAKLDWNTALTWDPQVLDTLNKAIEDAPKALDGANREGCPAG